MACENREPVSLSQNEKTLLSILDRIRNEYVDDITTKRLVMGSFYGMMRSLDPYSTYLPPHLYKTLKETTRGEIEGGIGLELIENKERMQVIAPLSGSPSEKAGILPGDVITHINGQALEPFTTREVVIEKFRGSPGTTLSLKLERKGEGVLEVIVERSIVSIPPARITKFEDFLYIKLNYFNKQTTDYVRESLKHDSFQGIILDLRNNPGGQFKQAIAVSGLFLPPSLIVMVKSRKAQNKKYYSQEFDYIPQVPLVLLINVGTASASEIVAGALKDHKRAVIIGTESFGKGSIQEIFPIKGFGGIKFTVAKFFTPNGDPIQERGIKPHIIVEDDKRVSNTQDFHVLYEVDLPFKKGIQYLRGYDNKDKPQDNKTTKTLCRYGCCQ